MQLLRVARQRDRLEPAALKLPADRDHALDASDHEVLMGVAAGLLSQIDHALRALYAIGRRGLDRLQPERRC